MCLTQDGPPFTHIEQARRLCAAGARWIQLRMKGAAPKAWIDTARAVVAICRAHDAICIINDNVDVALAAGADGAHLNWRDEDWMPARERLGPNRILGGTVNHETDALRAARCAALDYAGIGPWRFTTTKQNLAPLLGATGIRALIPRLEGLPAWAIGGIDASDAAAVRRTGATGCAVSSALYRDGRIEDNYRALADAWQDAAATVSS